MDQLLLLFEISGHVFDLLKILQVLRYALVQVYLRHLFNRKLKYIAMDRLSVQRNSQRRKENGNSLAPLLESAA